MSVQRVLSVCYACAMRVLRVRTGECTIRVNEWWITNEYKTSNGELLHPPQLGIKRGPLSVHEYRA